MLSNLNIFYQNLGRARSKLKDIYINILNNDYDIICMTESNFDSSVFDGESIDCRYSVYRRDLSILSSLSPLEYIHIRQTTWVCEKEIHTK